MKVRTTAMRCLLQLTGLLVVGAGVCAEPARPTDPVSVKARDARGWRIESYLVTETGSQAEPVLNATLLGTQGRPLGVYDHAWRYSGNAAAKRAKWVQQHEVLGWASDTLDVTTSRATGESALVFNGTFVGTLAPNRGVDSATDVFVHEHEVIFRLLGAVRHDLEHLHPLDR